MRWQALILSTECNLTYTASKRRPWPAEASSNSHYREVFVQYYATLEISCRPLYLQNSYRALSKASSVYIKRYEIGQRPGLGGRFFGDPIAPNMILSRLNRVYFIRRTIGRHGGG